MLSFAKHLSAHAHQRDPCGVTDTRLCHAAPGGHPISLPRAYRRDLTGSPSTGQANYLTQLVD